MEKLANYIYKLNFDSNLYFLDINKKIIIDTCPPAHKDEVKKELSKLIDPEKVQIVILTHLHYDHMGNFDLFPNAKFYTSAEAIASLKNDAMGTILNAKVAEDFNITLNPLEELEGFEIIKTPGHTKGSFCLFWKKDKILFSGDTLFFNGYGRLDLPSSVPGVMEDSLNKLKNIDYDILAPGHDY